MVRRPPRSTLFPSTTLFRSISLRAGAGAARAGSIPSPPPAPVGAVMGRGAAAGIPIVTAPVRVITTPVPNNPLSSIDPISGASRSRSASRLTSLNSIPRRPGAFCSSWASSFISSGFMGVRVGPEPLRRGGYRSMKFQQVGASITQAPRTVGGQMDIVLQPDAPPPRKIDPRLDRDYRSGRERGLGGPGEPRGLVHLEPDPVAERVPECVVVSGAGDDVARQGVGLPAGHAGADRLAGDALRQAHDLVDLPLPAVRRRPHDDGPGEVGAVPFELRAEIQQEPFAPAERAVAGAGVRERTPRPRGDDGLEWMPLAAATPEGVLQPGRHLLLGLYHPNSGEELGERLLRQVGRGAERLHLVRVLHHAKGSDQVSRRDRLRRLEASEALAIAHGQVVPLEAEPDPPIGVQQLAEPAPDITRIHHDLSRAAGLLRRLFRIAEVGEEHGPVRADQEQPRRAGETGQVPDVGWVEDEKSPEPLRGQPPPERRLSLLAPVTAHRATCRAPAAPAGSPPARGRRP